jgi:hypothetical protein
MLSLFRWLATDHGLATLDYLGWVLCGTGTIALLLGPKVTAGFAQFLDGIRAYLTPSRVAELSRRLILGVVGRVALGVFWVAMVGFLVFDAVEIFRAFHLADRGLPADRLGLAEFLLFISREYFVARTRPLPAVVMDWLIAATAPTLMPPMFCFGVIENLRAARGPRTETKTDGGRIREVVALWRAAFWRRQRKVNPLQQFYKAVVWTLLLFAREAGGLVGFAIHLVLIIVSYIGQALLLALVKLANRNSLKILVTALGFLLRTLAFLIKLSR